MKPLVSVVIPSYNRANIIGRAIDSVLCQTYSNIEVVVVDDASTDNTELVISQYNDSRLRYVKLEENVGGAEARNIGVKQAIGALVAFQDSDDEWLHNKLEQCVCFLENNPSCSVVFSQYWLIGGEFSRLMPYKKEVRYTNIYKSLLFGNFIGTPAAVVRKEVLSKIGGFDSSLPRYQDWDLFLRIASKFSIGFLEKPLVLAYFSDVSISRDDSAHGPALQKIYQKNYDAISANKVLHASWLWNIGIGSAASMSKKECLKCLWLSYKQTPLRLSKLVVLLSYLASGPGLYNYFLVKNEKIIRLIRGSRLFGHLKKVI